MGEPGTLYAAQAGVASIDHATQLSDETMRLMREKAHPRRSHLRHLRLLRRNIAARKTRQRERPRCSTTRSANSKSRSPPAFPSPSAPTSVRSRTARRRVELELMVQYGMKPLAVLQADMINGAKLLGWEGQIGELKPGYFADIIAVPGNPLDDITRGGTREFCDEKW